MGLVRRLLRGRKERQERWRRSFLRMSRVVGRGWLRDSVHRECQRGLLGAEGCGWSELAVKNIYGRDAHQFRGSFCRFRFLFVCGLRYSGYTLDVAWQEGRTRSLISRKMDS